jgi:hypothetical protein
LRKLIYVAREAVLGGAGCNWRELIDPLYPIDRFDDIGTRYWGWPDPNERGQ